ncbi:hypothetical protein Trydic_g23877 [Trypoxylus dichotomus]
MKSYLGYSNYFSRTFLEISQSYGVPQTFQRINHPTKTASSQLGPIVEGVKELGGSKDGKREGGRTVRTSLLLQTSKFREHTCWPKQLAAISRSVSGHLVRIQFSVART